MSARACMTCHDRSHARRLRDLFCVFPYRHTSKTELFRSLEGFELSQRIANEGKLIGMTWRNMERRSATGRHDSQVQFLFN